MSGSASIVTAEKMALAGNNESQDSQRVLDEYQRLYGIGLVSIFAWQSVAEPQAARVPGELRARHCFPADVLTASGACSRAALRRRTKHLSTKFRFLPQSVHKVQKLERRVCELLLPFIESKDLLFC